MVVHRVAVISSDLLFLASQPLRFSCNRFLKCGQIFFLLARKKGAASNSKACWTIKKCPRKRKLQCPAWEFQAGKLCWFINGTICEGEVQQNWQEKMKICRECEVLQSLLG
jgi:hypothetical protein